MAKYTVSVSWEGYSRGISTYIVEADSEEQAKENWDCGYEDFRETHRDDTDCEVESAELI
mgnify:CR=1 FL=1|tara:strand:- start:2259 stop:2438 length:180 start_codon:yes stop_codon:yes gene_type:complete